MIEASDILISVDQRHMARMLAGEKTVELRRRAVNVANGSRVWIYSKVPRGYVDAIGIVDQVAKGTPNSIWREYGSCTGISKHEFFAYFAGGDYAYAIVFGEIHKLKPILSLQDIRKRFSSFQPPQFFKRLHTGSPELHFFRTALV